MENYIVLVGQRGSPSLGRFVRDIVPFFEASGNSSGRWLCDTVCYETGPFTDINDEILSDLRARADLLLIDIFVVPAVNRRKQLLLADMDATIVTGETLDDLAELAGIGEEISAITMSAMRGELDFEAALRARVGKLSGFPETLLQDAYDRMVLSAGARTLVQTMAHFGAQCVLVSGGFTFFTSRVAARCGFMAHHGNVLGVAFDKLTGEVIPPILDKGAKLSYLHKYCSVLGIDADCAVTVGDGANDLPMLQAAGLGVGYQPKPVVRVAVKNSIIHTTLESLLYMQGYTSDEIAPFRE
ncbi:MAG: phosphoserine phosphatase SerB [Pseudobdellovibrionaceae bacterium]|jgi:phosphoserine phosphatase|nr:phosphoserine phosphatase SerB [Pseudobdellovibrionaceae bacterium]